MCALMFPACIICTSNTRLVEWSVVHVLETLRTFLSYQHASSPISNDIPSSNSTNVKSSINFPIGFVGLKPTVKIIDVVGVMLASLNGFPFDQANGQIARINLLHS